MLGKNLEVNLASGIPAPEAQTMSSYFSFFFKFIFHVASHIANSYSILKFSQIINQSRKRQFSIIVLGGNFEELIQLVKFGILPQPCTNHCNQKNKIIPPFGCEGGGG